MTARKTGAAEIPLLVQLARGDIVIRTSQELHVILENLSADPELAQHVAEVLERLLVTMGPWVVRLAEYMKYPARGVSSVSRTRLRLRRLRVSQSALPQYDSHACIFR